MKPKHTVTDRYFGYSDNELYFVSPIIGRERFIKLVTTYKWTTSNWVRERISEGANENALKALRENPGYMLVLKKKYWEMVKIVKKIKL